MRGEIEKRGERRDVSVRIFRRWRGDITHRRFRRNKIESGET